MANPPTGFDHGVTLAIETHFEFTSFELVRLMERCDAEPGDYLGVCLDTMNLLTAIRLLNRAYCVAVNRVLHRPMSSAV